jgi:hypothetical protein
MFLFENCTNASCAGIREQVEKLVHIGSHKNRSLAEVILELFKCPLKGRSPVDKIWFPLFELIKQWRCSDRKVGNILFLIGYPLPPIDDLLAKISKAKYITSLDLSKGYYQVKLDPETIPKTSFVTHCGKLEFVRLPFGLVNAPASFQQQMDVVLQHTDSDGYIDDIVVQSETWEDHLRKLRATLQVCREYELTLKLKKCCFGSAKLDFLGHSIGSGTLQPQTAKLQAILDYPLPKTSSPSLACYLCTTVTLLTAL